MINTVMNPDSVFRQIGQGFRGRAEEMRRRIAEAQRNGGGAREQEAITGAARKDLTGYIDQGEDAVAQAYDAAGGGMGSSMGRRRLDDFAREQDLARFEGRGRFTREDAARAKQIMETQQMLAGANAEEQAMRDAYAQTRIGSAGNAALAYTPAQGSMGGGQVPMGSGQTGGGDVESTVPGTGYIDFRGSRTALVGGKQVDVPNGFVPDEAFVQNLIAEDNARPFYQRETMPQIGAPSYDEIRRPVRESSTAQDLRDTQREYGGIMNEDYNPQEGPIRPRQDPALEAAINAKIQQAMQLMPAAVDREQADAYGALGKGGARLASDRMIEEGRMDRAKLSDEARTKDREIKMKDIEARLRTVIARPEINALFKRKERARQIIANAGVYPPEQVSAAEADIAAVDKEMETAANQLMGGVINRPGAIDPNLNQSKHGGVVIGKTKDGYDKIRMPDGKIKLEIP